MAKIDIEDLSGNTTPVNGNPYDGLISATNNKSVWLACTLSIPVSERPLGGATSTI